MFKVQQVKVFDLLNNGEEIYKTFLVYENNLGVIEPHILSKYIDVNYGTSAINTQRKYAEEVKKFLNFLITNNISPDRLSDLKLEHGAKYLRNLAYSVQIGDLKASTFYYIEQRLVHFYYWLNLSNLINDEGLNAYNIHHLKDFKGKVFVSPFKRLDLGIPYPSRVHSVSSQLHDFGVDKKKYIRLFLNITEMLWPEILLGIYLQFFGGLRVGEIINLKRNSLAQSEGYSSKPLIATIEDNWEQIFNSENTGIIHKQVKKIREQPIIKVAQLQEVLNRHQIILDKFKIPEEGPLFVSYKSKKPIDGQGYRYRFNLIRDRFIETLKLTDELGYKYMTSKNWSTHIGRGNYTNMLKFELGLDASEMKLFRGDSSISSSEVYLEKANAFESLDKHVEALDKLLEE